MAIVVTKRTGYSWVHVCGNCTNQYKRCTAGYICQVVIVTNNRCTAGYIWQWLCCRSGTQQDRSDSAVLPTRTTGTHTVVIYSMLSCLVLPRQLSLLIVDFSCVNLFAFSFVTEIPSVVAKSQQTAPSILPYTL